MYWVDKVCLAAVCVLVVVLIGTAAAQHRRGSGQGFLGFIGICGAALAGLAGLATLEAPPDTNDKFGGGRGDYGRGVKARVPNQKTDEDGDEKIELQDPLTLVTNSDAIKDGPTGDSNRTTSPEDTLKALVLSAKTMVEYKDIEHRTPYAGKKDPKADKGLRRAVHNGQLKLFLTELQFLTMYLESKDSPCYVVYAGSAPSHKLGMLMALFPKTKFVLIDPAEHLIEYLTTNGARETQYSPNRVSDQLYFKAVNDDRYRKRVGDKVVRMINLHGSPGPVSREGTALTAIPGTKELVQVIRDSPQQAYIIEDYMSEQYAEWLAPLGDDTGCPLLFVSDIRTNIGKEAPTNFDIIWNSAQHLNWLKRLHPAHYILKFHPPYPDGPQQIRGGLKEYERRTEMHRDVSNCKVMVDFLKNYKDGKFVYLKGDHIFIQAFAPLNSTEVRLVGSDIDQMVEYDMTEFEERMRYYNVFHRPLGNHGDMLGYENRGLGIDRCGDCAIAGQIFKNYLQKYEGDVSPSKVAALFQRVLVSIKRNLFSDHNMHGKDNIHTALVPGKASNPEDAVDHLCYGHALCKLDHTPQWKTMTAEELLQWAELRNQGAEGVKHLGPQSLSGEAVMDSVMPAAIMGILFGRRVGKYYIDMMMIKIEKIIGAPNDKKFVPTFMNFARRAFDGQLPISEPLKAKYNGAVLDACNIFTDVFSRGRSLVRNHCGVDEAIAASVARPSRLVEVSMVGQGYYTSPAAGGVLPAGVSSYEQRSILGPAQSLNCNETYGANTVILIYLLGVPSAAATLIDERIRKSNSQSHIITINHDQGRVPGPEFAQKLNCSCGKQCQDMFMLATAPARN